MEDKSSLIPTELWIQILTELRHRSGDPTPGIVCLPSTLVPWLSVSRRFHDIAEPLVYEILLIDLHSKGFNATSNAILASLECNPRRAGFVRHLSLYAHHCQCGCEVPTEITELSIDTSRLEAILPSFLRLKEVEAHFTDLSSHLLTRLLRTPSLKSPTLEKIVLLGCSISGKSQFVLPQPLSRLTQLNLVVEDCEHRRTQLVSDTEPTLVVSFGEENVSFGDTCLISFIQSIPKLERLAADPTYLRHLVLATKAHPSCLKSLRSFTLISHPAQLTIQNDLILLLRNLPLLEDLNLGSVGEMAAAEPYFGTESPRSPPQAHLELPNIKFFKGLPFMANYLLRGRTLDTLNLIVQPNYLTKSSPDTIGVAHARCLEILFRRWHSGLLSLLVADLSGIEEVTIELCECDEGPYSYDFMDSLSLFPDVRRFRMKMCETIRKKRASVPETEEKGALAEACLIRPELVEIQIPFGRIWQRRNTQSKWCPQEGRW